MSGVKIPTKGARERNSGRKGKYEATSTVLFARKYTTATQSQLNTFYRCKANRCMRRNRRGLRIVPQQPKFIDVSYGMVMTCL